MANPTMRGRSTIQSYHHLRTNLALLNFGGIGQSWNGCLVYLRLLCKLSLGLPGPLAQVLSPYYEDEGPSMTLHRVCSLSGRTAKLMSS